ncbi:MAG: carbohydrate-binding family 9-like protein [Candidatus Firestonebacteria bacterium]
MKIAKVVLSVLIAEFVFAEDKVVNCVKVSEAPAIDGKIDEKVWKKCKPATNFVFNFEEELSKKKSLEGKLKDLQGTPASQQTTVWLCYDNNNLYAAFKCEDANPSKIRAAVQGADGNVYLDDCVELFLDSENTKNSYYHIVMNSLGISYDASVKFVKTSKKNQTVRDRNVKWNAEGEIKGFVGDTFWSLEASFPLEKFKLKPKAGQKCGVNFSREQYSNEEIPNSFSLWAPLTGTFHQPDKFGTLIFK